MKNIVALLIALIPATLISIDYKRATIEAVKIAEDIVNVPPLDSVRIKPRGKEIVISLETADLAAKPIDHNGTLPMHWVAKQGTVRDLEILTRLGASINGTNRWDETPLMKAVEGGKLQNVGYLLSQGALLTQENHPMSRFNPFHFAVKKPLASGSKINKEKTTVAIIKLLAEYDPARQYINMASRQGTPLELALKNNQPAAVIEAFINNGAEITRQAYQVGHKNPAIAPLFKNYGRVIAY